MAAAAKTRPPPSNAEASTAPWVTEDKTPLHVHICQRMENKKKLETIRHISRRSSPPLTYQATTKSRKKWLSCKNRYHERCSRSINHHQIRFRKGSLRRVCEVKLEFQRLVHTLFDMSTDKVESQARGPAPHGGGSQQGKPQLPVLALKPGVSFIHHDNCGSIDLERSLQGLSQNQWLRPLLPFRTTNIYIPLFGQWGCH